jgi:hypothetical protein
VARTLQQLTIFVSGPGTVEAEKAALRVAVEEINRRAEKTHAVTLRVVGWPDDIRPGVSSDPQSEIDHQIGSGFDIYVGIIGSRFGTPTARSGSGTEQEFEDTLARFKNDPTSVRVLFYFKRGGEDPFSIDPSQLQKVLNFRQSLGSRGVLYRDVQDTADFSKQVREHIDSLIIDEWRGEKWLSVTPSASDKEPGVQLQVALPVGKSVVAASVAELDDEELGLFDFIAAFQDASDASVRVMGDIAQETERVGREISLRAEEIQRINAETAKLKGIGGSRQQQQLLSETRASIDHAAANLDDYTSAMAPNVERFRALNRAMFDNLRRAFYSRSELGPQENLSDRQALTDMIPSIRESRKRVMEFQTSIAAMPAMTGKFRRSRKRAEAILGEMVAEMSFSMQEATVLLEEMGGPPEAKVIEYPVAPGTSNAS